MDIRNKFSFEEQIFLRAFKTLNKEDLIKRIIDVKTDTEYRELELFKSELVCKLKKLSQEEIYTLMIEV